MLRIALHFCPKSRVKLADTMPMMPLRVPWCIPESPFAIAAPAPQIASTNPPIPYDLPRTEDFAGLQMVFFVDVSTDGTIAVEGNVMASNEAFRARAKQNELNS